MDSPEREQLDAIVGALARLVHRFDNMEARLARLEDKSGSAPPTLKPAAPPVYAPLPEPIPLPRVVQPDPVPATPGPEALETRMGLTWINRIGVVTLIIGIAFFFKYAVDSHWIGESGRVILGILFGLATLIAADRLWNRDQKIFAQGVFGLGLSLLYLSFYASFGFYHIVPQAFAFALMALTTVTAGAVSLRYDAVSIAVLGLLGGYMTPVLLSTGVDRPWIFLGYLLLLDLGAIAIGRVKESWALEALAFVATGVLYYSWFNEWLSPQTRLAATVFALAFYALFTLVDFPLLFVVAQSLVALALVAIWPLHPSVFFLLSLALAAAGLIVAALRRWDRPALAPLAWFWIAYACWSYHGEPAAAVMAGLTAGFLLFFAWTQWRLIGEKQSEHNAAMLALALNGPAYFAASYALLNAGYRDWMGLFAAALAGLHLSAGIAMWRSKPETERDPTPALLAAGVAIGFLTLAAPIQFSGFRITLGWALEGAALTWIASRLNRQLIAAAGSLLFALVLARLIAIDAWMYLDAAAYSTLTNPRFLTFLVSAIALWLAARWTREPSLALVYYVAGHVVMLCGVAMEIFGWAERHVTADNLTNAQSMIFSIWLALYAVLLVAVGVVKRSGMNRILGLVLIAAVVAKLYLYDVWQLRRLYRMGAFVGLGALLLATSYLYSRHRVMIDRWLKDDSAPH
ncbi:MAG: DUF2339 domain-containing protein [Bryobacteraceae bacterium]